ncbi:pyridoxamine 5'-phosphate oxidase family protein [Rhizobium sp. KVB221]|uniref:Pyridoxamine 5'-phosphate oxidase family protein n=1 Tax=Rhizobium setariae TaxID=2801340 RepID=A0A936YNX4_9HYPH|nr:pyridoxamine 5'-phosphate oxidase family protein [Rhizobium setariae]MBL0373963.1 pyridoxamine 5'-phosphate oxidase family protein [Rhizobium setariae]
MTSNIFQAIVQRLIEASTSRSAFNFLQLATIGLDGSPNLRTIVLRRFDPAAGALSFVTDIRSPKIEQLRRDPRVSLVGFDPSALIQLRVAGQATVVSDDGIRRNVWHSLRGKTLILFDAPLAPGTMINDSDAPSHDKDEDDAPAEPFDRFALVTVTLSHMEWLDLSLPQNERFAFQRRGDDWVGNRLAP